MSDKLARFRALVATDVRFRGGDKRDNSDNSSTDEGPSEGFTREASAIVTIVPVVTGDGSTGKAKTPLSQKVDINPSIIEGDTGDKRANSDNRSVTLDFETRNTGGCKLKAAGAWRYAADPATEVITLTYHIDGEYHLWTPALPYLPLASLAADPTVTFVSHSGFEQAVWHHVMVERYGFLPIPIARWHDTQAACAYHALPLDLERALTVL